MPGRAGEPGGYVPLVESAPGDELPERHGSAVQRGVAAARRGAEHAGQLTLDGPAVLGYLGEHIADFKVPQYVAVSPAPLPRNPGGKLLKRKLREETDWAAAARR